MCKNLRKRVQVEKENTPNDVSQEINEDEIMGHEIDINDREKKEEYDESDVDDVIEEETELENYEYDVEPYPRPSSSIAGPSNAITLPDRASSCPPKTSPLVTRRKKNYIDISEKTRKNRLAELEKAAKTLLGPNARVTMSPKKKLNVNPETSLKLLKSTNMTYNSYRGLRKEGLGKKFVKLNKFNLNNFFSIFYIQIT